MDGDDERKRVQIDVSRSEEACPVVRIRFCTSSIHLLTSNLSDPPQNLPSDPSRLHTLVSSPAWIHYLRKYSILSGLLATIPKRSATISVRSPTCNFCLPASKMNIPNPKQKVGVHFDERRTAEVFGPKRVRGSANSWYVRVTQTHNYPFLSLLSFSISRPSVLDVLVTCPRAGVWLPSFLSTRLLLRFQQTHIPVVTEPSSSNNFSLRLLSDKDVLQLSSIVQCTYEELEIQFKTTVQSPAFI